MIVQNRLVSRRGFEGVLLGVCSSVDVTQSEGDLPDFTRNATSTPSQHLNC